MLRATTILRCSQADIGFYELKALLDKLWALHSITYEIHFEVDEQGTQEFCVRIQAVDSCTGWKDTSRIKEARRAFQAGIKEINKNLIEATIINNKNRERDSSYAKNH
jgi:hypothetical protein